MGVPQLELYYAAAQIHWIMNWIEDPLGSESRMINTALEHSDVHRWLLGHETLLQRSNILLITADRIWHRYVIAGERPPPYSPKIPLTAIPGADKINGRLVLANWVGKGIQTVGDLFAEGRLLTYEELANMLTLGNGKFITYGALQHLVRTAWGVGGREPESSPVLHELLSGSGKIATKLDCLGNLGLKHKATDGNVGTATTVDELGSLQNPCKVKP
ncbi:hypothetical protein NDU88_003966 [Pleurodeles waltl]|uniref:Uncharacterized protein n=1 Tax=Pleurodeles waltl TaxID=8319 RepID=A0AAV7W7M6_PLEWA|nr:hypothetical protein NDU88_003966 [Pleurodeles waltl]